MLCCNTINAQIIEREPPKEWEQLVVGGKYMDRFEAMPQGTLSNKVWGSKDVLPRYIDNGIESSSISFWGGNILKGEDGMYHLFVCGWLENSPEGHMFWGNSTVFHTISKTPHGPYTVVNSIGKGHNPEAFQLADGRFVVYVIDGYYIADKMEGPWIYGKFNFGKRDRKIIEGLSNLSFTTRQDSSKLMVCRGGGIWISKDGLSTYHQLTDKRVYPDVEGCFEDPVIWRDELQYHLIVNDWLGRIAFYQRSMDGLHWITEAGEAYIPGITFHEDGKVENWYKYERAKVLQDEYGRVTQMNFAVIDTSKWEDLPDDNHSSKNICIPMNKGLLLSVLNQEPIDSKTRKIEVLIKAEEGMCPQTDIDVASLRFGTHSEVNFGRGAKAIKTKIAGKDLIVTFQRKNSGITEEEFAPKLIGRNKQGKLVYGYAKMPYINYTPAILSARKPIYQEEKISVEIQNFGLTASTDCAIKVLFNGEQIAAGEVPSLQPYEKKICFITSAPFELNDKDTLEMIFEKEGVEFERNKFIK